MQNIIVCTYEYDIDLEKLLSKRLKQYDKRIDITASESKKILYLEVSEETDLKQLCAALSELILLDLRHFEIARMVNLLNLPVEDKKQVTTTAACTAVHYMDFSKTAEQLFEYFSTNRRMVLEGYLRFILQDVIEIWNVCIDVAAEELLLREEYTELLKLLSLFTELSPPNEQEITLILHSDGSCTLTDNDNLRIECALNSDDGVLSMLIGMSPRKILIYDLSCGHFDAMKATIKLIFGPRVECYS